MLLTRVSVAFCDPKLGVIPTTCSLGSDATCESQVHRHLYVISTKSPDPLWFQKDQSHVAVPAGQPGAWQSSGHTLGYQDHLVNDDLEARAFSA